MISKNEFIKHSIMGRPATYNAEEHISILYDILSKGEAISVFCVKANISKATFFEWKAKHSEFKFAYDIAINFAESFWESIPFKNPDFNYPHWSINMRNRFGFGRSQFKLADKKKASEMTQSAKEHLDQEMININEYTAIVNSAKTQAIIDGEVEENENSYRYKSREELLERRAIIKDIVEVEERIKNL